MGKFHESIFNHHKEFIESQHLFFVSTAPLKAEGHINLSPKGLDSFRILSATRVAYMDIVGVHYAATKAALIGFTRHVAGELGPYNVRVNAVGPGRIETPMVEAIGEDANKRWVDQTPMGRLGRPEEVADLVLYLTSDEASFVTLS